MTGIDRQSGAIKPSDVRSLQPDPCRICEVITGFWNLIR